MPLPKMTPGKKTNPLGSLPDIEPSYNPISQSQQDEGVFEVLPSTEVDIQDVLDDEEDDSMEEYVQNKIEEEDDVKEEELVPQYDDPFQKGTYQEEDEDKFIDKKKLKIKPFGGNKSKNKKTVARVNDFDSRKNAQITVKIFRSIMLVIIVGLFLFGLKNTFMPSHVYTQEDITAIAQQAVGQTGFPMNRGRAFAEQFTSAYFEFSSDNEILSTKVNSFYNGKTGAASTSIVRNGKNVQTLVSAPVVFSEIAVSDKVATYSVSALVTNREGKTVTDDGSLATKWLALNVTVYYDSKTQELSIAKDSPQLIPSYGVGDNADQPPADVVGTGVAIPDLYPSMGPTINGFLKAYGKATSESHADIDQYVSAKPDPSLYAGFGGKFRMADGEKPLESNSVQIFPESDKEGNNTWKVVVTVPWEDASSTDNRDTLAYSGKYVLTIKKTSDNKYYVETFRPYVYTPAPETSK